MIKKNDHSMTDTYDSKELMEYISTTHKPRGDRRLAIVIHPNDSQPKTGEKSLLFAITEQLEDALIYLHTKYDTLTLSN